MYIKTLTFLILLSNQFCNAQFGELQPVTNNAIGARSVYAADVDGDGDMDVLSASTGDNKVAWHENSNGQGDFIEHVITISLEGAVDVYAADIDGDGDIDVLAADDSNDKIVWFKNLNGEGSYGTEQIITTLTDAAISVYATDLDGDGDIDVLSASVFDNKIAWYENTDGLGSFGPQQIISNSALSARDVFAADLDGDGDMDVIAAAPAGNAEVIWFKNLNGLGTFSEKIVITNTAIGVGSVYAADIDGDGDMDVLAGETIDNEVTWFENTDGLGAFGPEQIINNNAEFVRDIHAADLDNDGDIDVLSASSIDNKIAWYENLDGLGTFGPQQIISTDTDGPRSVFAADIDGDGDTDVLSASIVDSKIAWYENFTILGIEDNNIKDFSIYPNPTSTILNMNTKNIEIIKIEIYDVLGKKVLVTKGNTTQIDISNLDSGLYLVNIQTKQGVLVKKIVKE